MAIELPPLSERALQIERLVYGEPDRREYPRELRARMPPELAARRRQLGAIKAADTRRRNKGIV